MVHPDVIDDRERRHNEARIELTAIEGRIVRQRDALLSLTTHGLDCDALPRTLARILEVTAATLGVGRVSIWRYNSSVTQIECVDLFDAAKAKHTSGAAITATDCPVYFRTLASSEVVAADDALNDPRTCEFADGYLLPLGITSMMDVPIHMKGVVIGVLCNEHVGPMRRWTDDEKSFGLGVANLISLALERCERSRAEAALMLQSAALNASADAVVITDDEGTIVWANPAFTELTGYAIDEALGENPRDLLRSGQQSPEFYDEMWATLHAGSVWRGELTNRRKDGSTYLEEMTITPVRNNPDGGITHHVAIKRDLTEHRKLESQFLQAQKMEVVGRLAGGIAHDFNNMLTVINGSAELAIGDLPVHHPVRNDLERIHESGKRAASLTRQLLAFSRKEIAVRQPLSVATSLTEFRGILQRLIGEDVTLDVRAEGAGTVIADPSQFEQVILNLAVNARDAMPLGGKLRIEARDLDPDTTPARPAGPFVCITVADSGGGIPAEVLPRIFEPFFTTKEEGKGTGLGLATVYGIVNQSGGTIEVDSRVGEGTTFTIYWPRVAPVAVSAVATATHSTAIAGKTVLVVEDEADVRDLAVRVLRSAGYRVLEAPSAGAALKLIRTVTEPIHLVVTDVVMPGAGGRELAATAQDLRPELLFLYTSGYTDDTVLSHGVELRTVEFLGKPYTPVALLDKVQSVLSGA